MTAVRVRAAGLAIRDGRVLAVQHEKDGRRYYLLPGGGVDAFERMGAALARELSEELGVTAVPGRLLMACDSIAPDRSRHILHLVFAVELAGEPRATARDPRVVGPAWLTATELAGATFYPDIVPWILRVLAGEAAPGAEVLAPEWT